MNQRDRIVAEFLKAVIGIIKEQNQRLTEKEWREYFNSGESELRSVIREEIDHAEVWIRARRNKEKTWVA